MDSSGVWNKEPSSVLLSHGESALSSALSRFTALFGMGRGGPNSLWLLSNSFECSKNPEKVKEDLIILRVDVR